MWEDVRHGLRSLRKNPAVTLIASLTLALAIGATTTIFSVVHAVLLSPLPFNEPERLVRMFATNPTEGIERAGLAGADFVDFRDRLTKVSFVGSYLWFGLALTTDERPRELTTILVTPGTLRELGQPLHGRTFLPEESEPGNHRVVVLGYGFWQSELGGDPSIVGDSLSLDQERYEVVGIMPASFAFPAPGIELWAPRTIDPAELSRDQRWWASIARLAEGVPIEEAQAEVSAMARGLEEAHPGTNQGWGAVLVPLHEQVVGHARPALLALLLSVGVVLLIACANVANLLLARGMVRQKETALKAALGASRGRLIRALITESLLLAVLGGLMGLWSAWLGVRALIQLGPEGLPRIEEVALDLPVVGFAVATTLLTGLVFGAIPALRLSGFELGSALSAGSRSIRGAVDGIQLRRVLSVAQLTLSLVLLVGAGLLLRSFLNLTNVDPGFRAERRLAIQLFVYGEKYPTPESQRVFFEQLFEEIEAVPGVRSVGGINTLPLSPIGGGAYPFHVVGRAEPEKVQVGYRVATPGYFETMGCRRIAGRTFDRTDRSEGPRVAILNDTAARRFFPGASPLGARFFDNENNRVEIVGVVGDVMHQGLNQEPSPEVFVPFDQATSGTMSVVVEAGIDPESVLTNVQESVWRIDPTQPIWRAFTLDTLIEENTAQSSFYSLLVSSFAGVALLLAAIGLYGVLSFSVLQRTQEIGVRLAMGAKSGDILRMILRDGSTMVASGIVLGLLSTVALGAIFTKLLAPLLFRVSPSDPATFVVVSSVLTLAGLLACLVPAHRAARLTPVAALRDE